MSELEELTDEVLFPLEGTIRYRGSLNAIREVTGEKRLERAMRPAHEGRVELPKGYVGPRPAIIGLIEAADATEPELENAGGDE